MRVEWAGKRIVYGGTKSGTELGSNAAGHTAAERTEGDTEREANSEGWVKRLRHHHHHKGVVYMSKGALKTSEKARSPSETTIPPLVGGGGGGGGIR